MSENHNDTTIYKIVPRKLWAAAEAWGQFEGAAIDLSDGYIHFSSASQVKETAHKHFRDQKDLLLVAIDATKLGDDLRWEISRGGALFPHLYAHLPMTAVISTVDLPLDEAGYPKFSAELT